MSKGDLRRLAAYHDGELGPLGRWRVRRRLARDPEAVARLDDLRSLGEVVRAVERGRAPDPDVWPALRAVLPPRVPAIPDALPGERPDDARPLPGLRWAATGLAGAAAAVVLTLTLSAGDAAPGPSVRWLDAHGRAAMVLQDDRDATIIWVVETGGTPEGAARAAEAADRGSP